MKAMRIIAMTEITKAEYVDHCVSFKIAGFATGKYQCNCTSCDRMFIGDKNAWTCLSCVAKAQVIDIVTLESQLTAANKRIKELERRLRPFADESKEWNKEAGAENDLKIRISPASGEDVGHGGIAKFNVGDLYHAAELLKDKPK